MHKIYVTLPAASIHQSSNCTGLEAAAEQQPNPTIQQAVDKQETQTYVSHLICVLHLCLFSSVLWLMIHEKKSQEFSLFQEHPQLQIETSLYNPNI